ncbi:MAG: carboxypeptidase-like regulatory domain-containing protein [Flavobacteriaceae bacterium]|nr:carboxypeptidase-like regulatory domain-containing protein [Flavobacteriaceae bacterium]
MNSKLIKYCWIFALLITVSCSEEGIDDSGSGTITGKVVAKGTNAPLPNVKIETTPVSNTVFTDENGDFILNEVTEGEYSVQAQLDGFITAFKASRVVSGQTNNVVFELEESTASNRPPEIPDLLSPGEGQILESIEANFVWVTTDPDEDELTFTLELRNDLNNDVLIFEDITEPVFTYSPLLLGAKYFWQVSASDGINSPVFSSVSSFEVIPAPIDNRFLFTRQTDGNNVIFSADQDGVEFQLTSQAENSFRARRNVAANKIAYLQTNGAQVDIYTMNRDGSGKFKVTSSLKPAGFNLNEINISWPENSDKIYFPNFDKLYSINSNGQGLQLVYQTPDGSFISEVDVNENVNRIALKTNNQNGYNINIFVIDFSGSLIATALTGVQGAASGLNLSFDGQNVLYTYDVSANQNATYRRLNSRAFIYNIPGDTTTDISEEKPGGTNDLDVRFSPNEAEIIFVNTSNDGISQKNIWKITLNDTNTRELLFSNGFMPDC